MIDKRLVDYLKNYIENGHLNIISTGFKEIDTILANIDTGSIITIGGRPCMGKTALMLDFLHNILKNNKKCLYFSLDMSSEQFIKRFLAQVSEIGNFQINNSKYLETHHKKKLNLSLNEIENYNLFLEDEYLNINQIIDKIKEIKPGYVFIDYIQRINISGRNQRNDAITEILNELKQTAKENNMIIFAVSQLSRAVEYRCDKRPVLSDLRDSGGIETVSDVVMFVYRDEYYNFRDENDYAMNKGRAEIIIAKNKTGHCGTVNLLFRNEIPKFYNS